MNERYFNQLFIVTRKNVSDTWADEEFVEVGRVRGFIEPLSGGLITKSGRVSTDSTHLLYCESRADILAGDILATLPGAEYVVTYAQQVGVSGRGDHMEASLSARA